MKGTNTAQVINSTTSDAPPGAPLKNPARSLGEAAAPRRRKITTKAMTSPPTRAARWRKILANKAPSTITP